ncbi:hypothetical protein AB4144_27035 [Rhizobiaceae sp. 2RAB30]
MRGDRIDPAERLRSAAPDSEPAALAAVGGSNAVIVVPPLRI